MNRAEALIAVSKAARELAKATEASWRASEHRCALGIDCSRAKMTTANARWMRAAEERDRKQAEFDAALARVGGGK